MYMYILENVGVDIFNLYSPEGYYDNYTRHPIYTAIIYRNTDAANYMISNGNNVSKMMLLPTLKGILEIFIDDCSYSSISSLISLNFSSMNSVISYGVNSNMSSSTSYKCKNKILDILTSKQLNNLKHIYN